MYEDAAALAHDANFLQTVKRVVEAVHAVPELARHVIMRLLELPADLQSEPPPNVLDMKVTHSLRITDILL